MESPKRDSPEVVTYRIPIIEVYHVTDDELRRLEEGCSQVGQDLTFAIASLSLGVAFAIALMTGDFRQPVGGILLTLTVVCLVVALYTGIRWWRARGITPDVVAKIRSRKTEPAVPPGQ